MFKNRKSLYLLASSVALFSTVYTLQACKTRAFNVAKNKDISISQDGRLYLIKKNREGNFTVQACPELSPIDCNKVYITVTQQQLIKDFLAARDQVALRLFEASKETGLAQSDHLLHLEKDQLLSTIAAMRQEGKNLMMGRFLPTVFSEQGKLYELYKADLNSKIQRINQIDNKLDPAKKAADLAYQRILIGDYVGSLSDTLFAVISGGKSVSLKITSQEADTLTPEENAEFESLILQQSIPQPKDLPRPLPSAEVISEMILQTALADYMKGGIYFPEQEFKKEQAKKQKEAQDNLIQAGNVMIKTQIECTPSYTIIAEETQRPDKKRRVTVTVDSFTFSINQDWKQLENNNPTASGSACAEQAGNKFEMYKLADSEKAIVRGAAQGFMPKFSKMEGREYSYNSIQEFSHFKVEEDIQICVTKNANSELISQSGWQICS